MTAKELLNQAKKKVTAAYITKIALLSAIAFILYMFAKFSLPFMFPSFLDMQFSELPALLAGFSLGPTAGAIVIIIKCLLKFPFSGTAFVGEITDMILGILYVVPASVIYARNKTKKNAVLGMIAGTILATAAAIAINRFVSVPFYVEFFFKGNFDVIVQICKPLYKNVTRANFYFYYLLVAVLPFNLLRLGLVSFVTFLVYKSLSKPLHWEVRRKAAPSSEPDRKKEGGSSAESEGKSEEIDRE